jgi:hypothetical protein
MTTHELKLYANWEHKGAKYGDVVMHLWFEERDAMEDALDEAIERPDVAYIDVIDVANGTTTRRYTRCAV